MSKNSQKRFVPWKRLVKESKKSAWVNFAFQSVEFQVPNIKQLNIFVAYLQDLQLVQPVLGQWCSFEPSLSQGLQAMGEATTTCAESQRNLIDSQKQSLIVVLKLKMCSR